MPAKRIVCLENMNELCEIKTETDEINILTQAIDSFNYAASKIEKQYHLLENRVKELDIELQEKNDSLEKNLKDKEEVKKFLINILESITTGIIVIDPDGYITTLNKAAEKITGFISEKVKGEKFKILFDSGFMRDVDLDPERINALNEILEVETELAKRDNEITNINLSIAPVLDSGKSLAGIVLTMQDITRMKRWEQKASRTDRLQAMGEMAVKIAHEVRNPLGSIKLFADMLNKELQSTTELKELSEHISSGVESINNIISNLLLFVKPQQSPDLKIIDIHDVLDGSIFFSGHLVKHDNSIKIKTKYYAAPVMVRGDKELLKQVALNLILNAIQAMPNGGELGILTSIAKSSQEQKKIAEIRFIDTGISISQKNISRIFDPFFTTKNNGTGLGLAIVHNILKAHDASIDITSSEKGTTCIVRIPIVEEKELKIEN
ncbi:MAG: PAS domain S-box protein [Deltaproteobacteria bacterium]|nr:PAS domain S-box protein [Deltaproteobacteria bacterium]